MTLRGRLHPRKIRNERRLLGGGVVGRLPHLLEKALKAAGWNVTAAEMRYVAKSFTEVSPAARKEVENFLNALDDHDDVHRVYAAFK